MYALLFWPINSLAPDTCPGPLPIPKARWASLNTSSDLCWAAQNILGDSSAKSKCQWNNCGTIPSYFQSERDFLWAIASQKPTSPPDLLAELTVNPQLWVSDVHFLPGNKSVKGTCVDVAGPHQLWCQPRITTALLLSKNKLFVINSLKHHFQILCLLQLFPLHGFPDCLCLNTNIFIWREALLYRHISLPLPSIHKGLSSGQERLTFPHFIFAWLSAELSQ